MCYLITVNLWRFVTLTRRRNYKYIKRYMNSLFMFEINRPMTHTSYIIRRDNHKAPCCCQKKFAENINFARMKRRDFDRDLIVAGWFFCKTQNLSLKIACIWSSNFKVHSKCTMFVGVFPEKRVKKRCTIGFALLQ